MTSRIVPALHTIPAELAGLDTVLPDMIRRADERTYWRFIGFFAESIRNRNTRLAYFRAVLQFLAWCEGRGLNELHHIKPIHVAIYVETMDASVPTIKQRCSAINKMFNWLVSGGLLELNPASSVQAPKLITRKGKTPVLTAEQTRLLLDSIELDTIAGFRDRALIGAMVYTLGRVSAVIGMNVEDYYESGKRAWFRLHEKGGKRHEMPAHHNAAEYVDAYLHMAGIRGDKKTPLFRSVHRYNHSAITENRPHRNDVLAMIKRRAKGAGLPDTTNCHTFRATGITTYLENGGTLDKARAMAAHASTQTTKLYNRTNDEPTLDEVERIVI